MKGAASRGAGRTPLFKSIELCGRCNGAKVFVKDESKNPFGTFKDRRCAALLEHHSSKKELVFVHITSGNSGYSLGRMAAEEARKTGKKIHVVNIVPEGSSPKTIETLKTCSTVVEMDLGKLITMERMKRIAKKATGYNGLDSNIVGVEDYGLANGYGTIVREIHEEGLKPDYIFCPVGEGELFVELATTSREIWGKDAPMIVGTTIKNNVLTGKKVFDPKPGKNLADKLVNGYSKFNSLISRLISKGHVELDTIDDESAIAEEYKYLGRIGLSVEPSSAVAFLGARQYELKQDDTVVIVNTGKGIYDPSLVQKVWKFRLRRIFKTAAILAAGAILGLGMYFGIKQYNAYELLKKMELAQETDLIAQNDGWSFVSPDKFVRACTKIPDMTREKCKKAGSFSFLTERQIRFYRLVNTFDDDAPLRRMIPLFEDWYLKYDGIRYNLWMPGEEQPEEYKLNYWGQPIESSRKTKLEYLKDCDRYKKQEITLPPSIDYCGTNPSH
jgi:threonine synthase